MHSPSIYSSLSQATFYSSHNSSVLHKYHCWAVVSFPCVYKLMQVATSATERITRHWESHLNELHLYVTDTGNTLPEATLGTSFTFYLIKSWVGIPLPWDNAKLPWFRQSCWENEKGAVPKTRVPFHVVCLLKEELDISYLDCWIKCADESCKENSFLKSPTEYRSWIKKEETQLWQSN